MYVLQSVDVGTDFQVSK